MKKHHPDPFEYLPISHKLYVSLTAAEMASELGTWEIVEAALDAWLRQHAPNEVGEPTFAGYQWKGLFLPDGTVLRTAFHGKQHHCHVKGDQIMHEKKPVSPSGFVSAVGGVRRNAWRSIWLLLPDCKHWQRADSLRVRPHTTPARRRPSTPQAGRVQRDPAAPAIVLAASAQHARSLPRPLFMAPAALPGSNYAVPLTSLYRWSAGPAGP